MKSAVMERPVSPGRVELIVSVQCAVPSCTKSLKVPAIAVTKDGGVNPEYAWKPVGEALTSDHFFYCGNRCKERYCGE